MNIYFMFLKTSQFYAGGTTDSYAKKPDIFMEIPREESFLKSVLCVDL